MEGYSRKDEGCLQFLDLIPKEKRDWVIKSAEQTSHGLSEEKKLELRLGPPGGDSDCDWTTIKESPWLHHHQAKPRFLLHLPTVMKESSQPCSNNKVAEKKTSEKKAFSPAPANTAVPNSSSAQKRTAPAPVVGWPPIRSFRKNLASGSSSKLATDSTDVSPNQVSGEKNNTENRPRNMFVKINMDGIPIGRKVDLKAYDSYEKLSYAVDELFSGLLAAQSDSTNGGIEKEGGKVIGGLLDGNREYTLVYEDNEGDRMLVGDVPWHMFVSTVKRLRVLKSSELPTLSRGSKHGKVSFDG